jgi:hypothetical protein
MKVEVRGMLRMNSLGVSTMPELDCIRPLPYGA